MPRPGGYYSGALGGALPGATVGAQGSQAADLNCPAGVETVTGISSPLLLNEDGNYVIAMGCCLAIQLGAAAPTALAIGLNGPALLGGSFDILNVPPSRLVNNALLPLDLTLLVGDEAVARGTYPLFLEIHPTAQAVTLKAGSTGAAFALHMQD